MKKKELAFKIKKFLLMTSFSSLIYISEFKLTGKMQNIFNQKAVIEYDNIIEDFTNLLLSNDIKNPMDVFECYNYALWGGYFSNNHQFQFTSSRDLYFDNAGIECITGKGVCLNIADMLTDNFRKLGYNANTIIYYVTSNEVNITPLHNDALINRNTNYEESTILQFISKLGIISGNHAITCVENNGEYYYFDTTNLIYFDKYSLNDIKIINGNGNLELRYLSSLVFSDIGSIKGILSKNNESYKDEVYNKNTIDLSILDLENFYLNHAEQYSNISDNLESKPQPLFIILMSFMIFQIAKSIINKITEAYFKDFTDNYDLFLNHLMNFLNKYDLDDDYDYAFNLWNMLENGYLSYKNGDLEYKQKYLTKDVGQEFLFDKTCFKGKIISTILNMCGYQTFYINTICFNNLKITKIMGITKNEENCDIHFYDCEKNAILLKTKENILIDCNTNEQYKILKVESNFDNKKKIKEYKSKSEINPINVISSEEFKTYYQENEELMENIVKKLIKIKEE